MQPGSPPISPDGRFWWDGSAWQPLFTPDGMFRWNGQAWTQLTAPYGPEAAPAPVPMVAAVAAAAPVLVAPQAPVPVAAHVEYRPEWLPAAPLAPPPAVVSEPEPAPAWAPPPRQSKLLVYFVGALVGALLLGGGGWVVRGQLMAHQADGGSLASPTPFGSDYERADRFLNTELAPSINEVDKTLPALTSSCTAKLPPSCRDAIAVTDQKMRETSKVIDKGDIPPCIANSVTQFTTDWSAMEAGLEMALGGYTSGSNELIARGLIAFGTAAKPLKTDADAMQKAELTCKH